MELKMKVFLLMFGYFLLLQPIDSEKIDSNCSIKGFKLYGKVKVVESFPDIKVQIVDSFPDLKVKIVENFPNKCGEWKMVKDFPDVKIKFVTSFGDIKIKYVSSFPGLN
jgi:hypothetical protein